MNIITRICFLIILASLSTAWAGEKGGNGGDAVVCRDEKNQIISAEALDRYEARYLRDILPNMPEHLSTSELVEFVLNRFSTASPIRMSDYKEVAKLFFKEAKFLVGQSLVDIPDSAHLTFPNHCKVEQLVIQVKVQFPQDKRYIINKDIWDQLSSVDQAIMIIHELILNEMIVSAGANFNTSNLRYFNSILFSGMIESLNYHDFLDLLSKVGNFKFYEHPSVIGRIPLNALRKVENGQYWLNPNYHDGYYKRIIKAFEGVVFDGESEREVKTKLWYVLDSNPVIVYDCVNFEGKENCIPGNFQMYFAFDEYPSGPVNLTHFSFYDQKLNSRIEKTTENQIKFTNVIQFNELQINDCKIELGDGNGDVLLDGEYNLSTMKITKLFVRVDRFSRSYVIKCGNQTRTVKLIPGQVLELNGSERF